MFFRYHAAKESLDTLPVGGPIIMQSYSPYSSPIGRNVLRRYKSVEEMWSHARRPAFATWPHARRPGLTLWCRDDAYWLYPLDLSVLMSYKASPDVPNTLFSRNCKRYGGINDKCLVMGAEAADKMLTAYSAVWTNDSRLVSAIAEEYLRKLAWTRGVTVQEVPFLQMPCIDSMFQRGPHDTRSLCVKHHASCVSSLPVGSPPFCL